jgi:beta-N-acetylhexosaminidase
MACAKHFPGHGDTSTDSHLTLPRVEKELPALEGVELPPFAAAIEAGVASVMTAHVVFPALDEDRPATLSAKVLQPLLRQKLGFDGVVFSDDLEMKALHGRYSLRQQLDWGVRAGVDLFLCCKDTDLQVEAFETLVRLQEEDEGFERLLKDSDRRLLRLRERFFLRVSPAPGLEILGTMAHRVLAEQVRVRGGVV